MSSCFTFPACRHIIQHAHDHRRRLPNTTAPNVDFRRPMPRPKVNGPVIDFHCHLLAARHAQGLVRGRRPLRHRLLRHHDARSKRPSACSATGGRTACTSSPSRGGATVTPNWIDDWLRRIEAFYNLGSRIVKFHVAPGTMVTRGLASTRRSSSPSSARSSPARWRS